MSEFLSMRAYAKRRGVSPEAVSKAVRRGRISTVTDSEGNRKIDPEIADREWGATRDPSKLRANAKPDDSTSSMGKMNRPNMADAAAVLKTFQARLAQLDFQERSGKLVEAEQVEKKWIAIAAIVRTKIMGIPTRYRQRAPELSDSDYLILEAVTREVLEDLAENGEQ